MAKCLHHMAFRCRDSEETRAFYEDVIGLELAAAIPLEETKTGRPVRVLHTFFRMRDGSFLAFFEVPGEPFEFKPQHDFDLHVALTADPGEIRAATEAARARGLEVRGPASHGFIESVYFRDPNGYVVELTVPVAGKADVTDPARNRARQTLDEWRRSLRG